MVPLLCPILRDYILMFHPSFVCFHARERIHQLNREGDVRTRQTPARGQQMADAQAVLNQSRYECGQVTGHDCTNTYWLHQRGMSKARVPLYYDGLRQIETHTAGAL